MLNNNRYNIAIGLILILFVIVIVRENDDQPQLTNQNTDYTLNDTMSGEEDNYGVTSDNPIATEVGMKILEQGGNAVDAAIAVSFVLGVAEPQTSGIGGGGTMLIHPGKGETPAVYDYRETAPASIPSSDIGVPGFVKGMYEVHEDFGTINMDQLIEPSIHFAENGVPVSETLHRTLDEEADRLPELNHLYPDGEPIEAEELLKQKQLAETLKVIQAEGPSAFYNGEIANEINDSEEDIKEKDLEDYEVEVKEPLQGEFGGYDVFAPPPPSGGITLIQDLEMAELLQIEETKDNPLAFSLMIGMINRISYHDRLENVGDPNFTDVPINEMMSKDHIKDLASNVNETNMSEYRRDLESEADIENHDNTTHIVIVDKDGMMVSVTNTLSASFGSGEYVNGFFLNNQLKNFSNDEDSPNSPEPGKRPFSYTTPTILAKNGQPVIGIGGSGGRRITSIVAQQLVKMITFNEPVQESADDPRTFLEFHEDVLQAEHGYVFLREPEDLGITIEYSDDTDYFGSVQGLIIDYENDEIYGSSDPRRGGTWKSN
ncbi:gamma-glutamyltransferase [Oceanobacillus rekensis]|uniref:gamma-glutamyltransferase n=1 Tax=Oceanobacillus rekensis TaxID=937927 RepID=UPI000B43851C|nr:gamma-glutamyltransferase [Oceanobacillus rekensis]